MIICFVLIRFTLEYDMSYFPLFQYRECTAECDDKQKWKLHIFVYHVKPLLSFRSMGALNSKTRRDKNFRIATIVSIIVLNRK